MPYRDFVHLHIHTAYSLLDGAIRIPNLLDKISRTFKMPALAITDHGNMFGAIEFYTACHKIGVKPILGCEVYVAPKSRFDKQEEIKAERSQRTASYHLLLLAQDLDGYKNLMKLVTAGYLEGFYYRPRIDKELLSQHSKGLIGLSACLKGEIQQCLLENQFSAALDAAAEYRSIFGSDNFYLELHRHGIEEQKRIFGGLTKIAQELSIPLVATNDCHYLDQDDSTAHDILTCIKTGKMIDDKDRLRFASDQFYVRSAEEMGMLFADLPEALTNTRVIADRCNVELELGKLHLPDYKVPAGYNLDGYLEKLAQDGLDRILSKHKPTEQPSVQAYQERLTAELNMIKKQSFSGYFLIVWDVVNYARSKNIPVGPGRGSATGSLAAYALGITNLDPLLYDLFFERFLNPDRHSPPDIDIDFCVEGREEIIHYVSEKFGREHVSQIITFGSMGARSVIKDVGRVLGIPYSKVDKITKLIPFSPGITLNDAIKSEPKLAEIAKDPEDEKTKQLFDISKRLEGLPRHPSVHAAGVVIANRPLVEYCPLYKEKDDEETRTQYEMDSLEKIGLLKMDFLGLRTLTVINKTLKYIRKSATEIILETLPLDDKETFELLGQARTTGVFQLESSGMRDLVYKLKPTCFEDLIALIALYRPGPLRSGMVDDFIRSKNEGKKVKYDHPSLENILRDTYGVIIYQEQVMQIASSLAGFSLAEADNLRRAMAKKLTDVMSEQSAKFIEGAKTKGITKRLAEKIFSKMEKFAEYGFNKSHSAAYALISYQTAYLKQHYPLQFMAALLSSEANDAEKVIKNVTECRETSIKVLPPDVNESIADFTPSAEGIRFGLSAVKHLGENAVAAILTARNNGLFKDFIDFVERVDLRVLNRRALESLIRCGAFDFTGFTRQALDKSLEAVLNYVQQKSKSQQENQFQLFSPSQSSDFYPDVSIPALSEWHETERLAYERESIGFYITGHPLTRYEKDLKQFRIKNSSELRQLEPGSTVRIAGLIRQTRTQKTKAGDLMAILLVEDLEGVNEVILFPTLYKSVSSILNEEDVLVIQGKLEKDETHFKILAEELIKPEEIKQKFTNRVILKIQTTGLSVRELETLQEIILSNPGSCPVTIQFRIPDEALPCQVETELGAQYRIKVTSHFLSETEKLFGSGAILLE